MQKKFSLTKKKKEFLKNKIKNEIINLHSYIVSCFVLFTKSSQVSISSQVITNIFNFIPNRIPDSSASLYLIRNFQTFDKFNCLSACNENPQCISCVYDNNEICSLYNISIEANTLSLTSADSYIKDICK